MTYTKIAATSSEVYNKEKESNQRLYLKKNHYTSNF